MTAIRPAILKQESASLIEYYNNADKFVRELQRLLEHYADRTHRMGQAGEPRSILPSYNVPPPVMRQIFRDITDKTRNNPQETLFLCDKLWSQEYYELRSLAAFLLGQLHLDPPQPIIKRITEWINEVSNDRIVNVIVDYGMARIRIEAQAQLYSIAEAWLTTSNEQQIRVGIRVLISLVEHPTAEDIPMIFRLTTPLIRKTPVDVRPDVLVLWKHLAQSIPKETVYHLQQNLKVSENPDTRWFIRQLINEFPKELQEDLTNSLREKSVT